MTPAGRPADGMHLHEFGQLPIVDRGRVKPIDAMARTDLTIISGKQDAFTTTKRKKNTRPSNGCWTC